MTVSFDRSIIYLGISLAIAGSCCQNELCWDMAMSLNVTDHKALRMADAAFVTAFLLHLATLLIVGGAPIAFGLARLAFSCVRSWHCS